MRALWDIVGYFIAAIDTVVCGLSGHYRAALGEPHGWIYAIIVGAMVASGWATGVRVAWQRFRAGRIKPDTPRAAGEGLSQGLTAFGALAGAAFMIFAATWFIIRFFVPGEAIAPWIVSDALSDASQSVGESLGWVAPRVNTGLNRVATRSRPLVANMREILDIFGPVLATLAACAVAMVVLLRQTREWWKTQAPLTKLGAVALTACALPVIALFFSVVLKRASM